MLHWRHYTDLVLVVHVDISLCFLLHFVAVFFPDQATNCEMWLLTVCFPPAAAAAADRTFYFPRSNTWRILWRHVSCQNYYVHAEGKYRQKKKKKKSSTFELFVLPCYGIMRPPCLWRWRHNNFSLPRLWMGKCDILNSPFPWLRAYNDTSLPVREEFICGL